MYNLRGNPKETQVRNLAAKAEVVKISTDAYRIHGNTSIVYNIYTNKRAKSRYKPPKRGFKVMSL